MVRDWPRLSEDLGGPRSPLHCQSCGSLQSSPARWQEHDQDDQPGPIAVVLCEECSDELIEEHPRLYRRLERCEPFPGTMPICIDCELRQGVRCTSPSLRSNGGPGLSFPPPELAAHVDTVEGGRRVGRWLKTWGDFPGGCEGNFPANTRG